MCIRDRILNVLGWMECKSHGTTKGYWVGNVNYSNESLELQRWHDLISSDPFRDGRTLFFLDQPLCINHKMTNCPVGRTTCSRRNSLQREPYQVYRLRDAPRDIGVIYMPWCIPYGHGISYGFPHGISEPRVDSAEPGMELSHNTSMPCSTVVWPWDGLPWIAS